MCRKCVSTRNNRNEYEKYSGNSKLISHGNAKNPTVTNM